MFNSISENVVLSALKLKNNVVLDPVLNHKERG